MRDRVGAMRLGVDFGTTTTAIAIVDRGNYPIVSFVNNREDTVDFIPSVLALDGDRLIYGFDAEDAAREGAPHLRSFKRLLSDPSVTDTSTLRLGNHSISVLDALTGFLTYVARQLRTNSSVASLPASEKLEALVGIPAHAWSAQRFLTLEAFRRAGWDVLAMVNEPSAAGFEYTHRHAGTLNSKRTAILVYDLGGGTFDASIVSATGTLHEVLGSRGLNLVGGDDFDVILATRLAAAAGTDSGLLGDEAWERLIEDARSAKEALTPSTKFITVPVDGEPTTITVAEFYEDATALVNATMPWSPCSCRALPASDSSAAISRACTSWVAARSFPSSPVFCAPASADACTARPIRLPRPRLAWPSELTRRPRTRCASSSRAASAFSVSAMPVRSSPSTRCSSPTPSWLRVRP